MEWESRPDGAFEARSGTLLYRLTPDTRRRRDYGVWRLTVARVVTLPVALAFSAFDEARAAVRELDREGTGMTDDEFAALLASRARGRGR